MDGPCDICPTPNQHPFSFEGKPGKFFLWVMLLMVLIGGLLLSL